ncbi:putative permease, DMT superfamily [Rubidibacter lacunae KORDI 51-2]|uniref:Putative permease, DMT superfamily n=1 Tax=Rubidibacter lacunae KORDI 51-2 TaxID=582515 RepID=U5D9C8_9CHRO|nr:DMT family transporter [Rubidibacter lacunae]ERN41193.1 putative permease, DMT superfamily [Rubidibacter lacunae KORDI 51-2]
MHRPSSPPATSIVVAILTLGVFAVSTAAIFIRLSMVAAANTSIGFSLFVSATRLLFAALLVLPTWSGIRQPSVTSRATRYAIAAGACLCVHFATWITSLAFTSIAASVTLVTTNPIWVALLAWAFLGEKPTRASGLGIAIAIAGGALIAYGDADSGLAGSNPLLGDLLALVGAWAASAYFLLGREAQRCGLGIGNYVAIAYSTAALLLLPLPWLFGGRYTGHPSSVYFYILAMAIVSQIGGHTSFNWAVRWISPTLVALAILFEPVGSSLLGFVVFGEVPAPAVLFGAIVLLLGVGLAVRGSQMQNPPATSTGEW